MIRVVRECSECPFCTVDIVPAKCSVSTPKFRPLDVTLQRPTWCPLRREQVIVREGN
ncbi:MAG: hypothetical protein R3Y11_05460 [Pseudomonadota bacterium]